MFEVQKLDAKTKQQFIYCLFFFIAQLKHDLL